MTPRPRTSPAVGRLATLLPATLLFLSGLLASPLGVVASSTDPAVSPPGAPTVAFTAPGLSGPEPGAQLRPRPRPGPFSMNLYSKGDFVHQQTIYWCVAASVQTMINIVEDGEPDRSRRSQRRIHLEARALDPGHALFWRQLESGSAMKRGLHGLGLVHWAGMLNADGFGGRTRSTGRSLPREPSAGRRRRYGLPANPLAWSSGGARTPGSCPASRQQLTPPTPTTSRSPGLRLGPLVPRRQLDLGQVTTAQLRDHRLGVACRLPALRPSRPAASQA